MMTVWEAFCDTKLRNTFKHDYLSAQGIAIVKRNDLMTKFKVYLDRLNGIPDVLKLRKCTTVAEAMTLLRHIFEVKWRNHIHPDYREMPDLFMRFGHFLLAEQQRQAEPLLPDPTEGLDVTTPEVTDFERPYIGEDGKLRLIARPALIVAIKQRKSEGLRDSVADTTTAQHFYGADCFPQMTTVDWQHLEEQLLATNKKRDRSKTGSRHSRIRLCINNTTQDYAPLDALIEVGRRIGWKKVEQMRLKVKNMDLIVRRPSPKSVRCYTAIPDENLWINSAGSAAEKVRVLRIMGMLGRLNLNVEEVLD